MTRIPLDPRLARSQVEVRVRFGETDLMGIVHHASYLSYFEAARVAWLRRRGVTYATWAARGWHLPVVEANVRYKAPAYFDDVLAVQVELAEVRSHSLRFAYDIARGERRLAEGMTRLACVNHSHELQALPPALLEVLVHPEVISSDDAVS